MDLKEVWQARDLDSFTSAIRSIGNGFSNWMSGGYAIEQARISLGLDDWSGFKGSRVVDIGCGVSQITEHNKTYWFPPIYCYLMANLGAEVTGIDISPRMDKRLPHKNAGYNHVPLDLVDFFSDPYNHLYKELGFKKKSVRVVNVANFVGASPYMRDPGLARSLLEAQTDASVFEKQLALQIIDLLATSGVWIEDAKVRNKS